MSNQPNNPLPIKLDAEEAVLGSVLINPDAYFDVATFLKPADFYAAKNRIVWQAYAALHERSTPIDMLTVRDHLERQGKLDEIGNVVYLSHLAGVVPTAVHAEAYGRTVKEASTRRRLLDAAGDIAKLAYDEKTDIETVVQQSEQKLFGVNEDRTSSELVPIREVASALFDRIQELTDHGGEPLGVPSGFHDLDKLLGGFQRSDLIIIAGRPGQGKTAWMLSVTKHIAQEARKRVAFFSLEMSNEQLVQRLIAQETGVSTHKLRQGNLTSKELSRFVNAVGVISDLGIYLDDTPGLTPIQLRTKSRRLAAEVAIDLIVVDYLQLMTADLGKGVNRVQEVSYISRNLKTLARELNVPILAGAQLSRGVEQRKGQRPMLSDLRESGSIEQDADIVLFLHRPDDWKEDPSKQNVTELLLEKHRNGPTGNMSMIFLPEETRFVNAASITTELNEG